MGQGVTSCVFFLWLMMFGRPDRKLIVAEAVVVAALLAGSVYRAKRKGRTAAPVGEPSASCKGTLGKLRYGWLLAVAFYVTLVSTALSVMTALLRSPSGWSDAMTIWNFRARGIFRDGIHWRDHFSSLPIPWLLDYPLLLPASVVRGWTYAGGETAAAPAALSLLFTLGMAGLICSAVTALRGKSQGYLAGVVLMGCSLLIVNAESLGADLPLAFFFTATAVLITFHLELSGGSHGVLALAGMAAGFSAWTKNEGLLFIFSVTAAYLAVAPSAGGLKARLRQLLFFAAGLLPVLIIVIYFKTRLAPPNELASAMMSQKAVDNLLDYHRYVTVLRGFKDRILLYCGRGVNLAYLLPIYLVCAGAALRPERRRSVVFMAIWICLMLAGYSLTYLMTPYDLTWHINTSMDRLLLQLWPAVVFLFFLTAATPEEMLKGRGDPEGGAGRTHRTDEIQDTPL
jgi:hypothetical protein